MDSAILNLTRLGVELDKVVVETGGGGWPKGRILAQDPAPGTPIEAHSRIHLKVALWGGVESLPFPMRDEHPDEFRADRIFALFDNPVQKVSHHVRQGAGFLDLHPRDLKAQRRWLTEVFQFDVTPWPQQYWFSLVRLLAVLHKVAGHPSALPLAMKLLFELPVNHVEVVEGLSPFRDEQRTTLGLARTTLGVNAVLGAGLKGERAAVVHIGPVDLDVYLAHQSAELTELRRRARHLTLPAHLWELTDERWTVGDTEAPSVLGDEDQPVLLGINSRTSSVERADQLQRSTT